MLDVTTFVLMISTPQGRVLIADRRSGRSSLSFFVGVCKDKLFYQEN